MDYKKNIIDYIKARYAVLVIETFEEERVVSELYAIARQLNYNLFVWNSTMGVTFNGATIGEKTFDFRQAISFCENRAKEQGSRNLFVFCDAHNYLTDKSDPIYRRRLKDFAINIRAHYESNCILISPTLEISKDIEKDITIIDFPLPTRLEVKQIIASFINSYRNTPGIVINIGEELLERYVDASIGLTRLEIENCLARALVSDRCLDETDLKDILNEKKQIIRKTGILEYIDTK